MFPLGLQRMRFGRLFVTGGYIKKETKSRVRSTGFFLFQGAAFSPRYEEYTTGITN